MALTKSIVLFNAVTETATTDGAAVGTGVVTQPIVNDAASPALNGTFFLSVTASSGTTPTLDVKIQGKMPVSGAWVDLHSASFTQATAATSQAITVAGPLPPEIRAVATIGGTTPSFTFSVEGVLAG